MQQLTLVALYGAKPPAFAELVEQCQQLLRRRLGTCYRPYPEAQVHATLVGLERAASCATRHRHARDDEGPLDRRGFLRELVSTWRPLRLRFGGFADDDVAFTSRHQPPFRRSFSVQGDRTVLIGWPAEPGVDVVQGDTYPDSLETLRRRARAFGIRHAYHTGEGSRDNDGYLRLGFVDGVGTEDRACVERELRAFLACRSPLYLTVDRPDLVLVRYADESLPRETSEWRSLMENFEELL